MNFKLNECSSKYRLLLSNISIYSTKNLEIKVRKNAGNSKISK